MTAPCTANPSADGETGTLGGDQRRLLALVAAAGTFAGFEVDGGFAAVGAVRVDDGVPRAFDLAVGSLDGEYRLAHTRRAGRGGA